MTMQLIAEPLRQRLFAPSGVEIEHRDDGTILLRSPAQAPAHARRLGEWLVAWARTAPNRTFLAERPEPGSVWRTISYRSALDAVQRIATFLLKADLSPQRPVAILSENGIDHALLALAAMHIGVPVAAISPAYSLQSSDHRKLREMVSLLRPGLIYVSDARIYARALDAIAGLHDAVLVASKGETSRDQVVGFEAAQPEPEIHMVQQAFASIGPDAVARLLFTSGSTGIPKAVINTHRMLCSNQEARVLAWPFLAEDPPVLVDWLPWSHTFGANHNFNMVLRNGGTLYIDAGKPAPGGFETTIANIKEIGPSLSFNVPRGYDMLVQAMADDPTLRKRFFGNVRAIHYAAAALPESLWRSIEKLAIATRGCATPLVSSWGATETAPLATDCSFRPERPGNIGLPIAGTQIKLVPNAGKLEIRVRGPNVTPGYWKQPGLFAQALDEEGFFRTGDAARLADPDRPELGLYFDGRIAEDFKLASGTWVSVGDIRLRGIAALDPIAQDIVVTGHDRDSVGFLVFPNIAACRRISGLAAEAETRAVLDHPAVRGCVAKGLCALKKGSGGSSRYAARARLMEHPPVVDAGEITDKGYVNQSVVLSRRAGEVATLHGDDPAAFIAVGEQAKGPHDDR